MTTPGEVQFELQRKLLALAQGSRIPVIGGVHSVVVEGDTVDAIFDIEPDPSGCGLHFAFPLPQSVSRDNVRAFTAWLAWSSHGETVH